MSIVISCDNITLARGGEILLHEANLLLNQGECILITGDSGCGKTSLCEVIVGRLYAEGKININLTNKNHDITYVSQYSTFKDKTGMSDFYYQQRFNSYDADNTVTVNEYLATLPNLNAQVLDELLELFNFRTKLASSLLYLSSGERKKLQLISTLSNAGGLIVLDNPFIGLDKLTVGKFYAYLTQLNAAGVTLIIVANLVTIPEFISHVCHIQHKQITKFARADYVQNTIIENQPSLRLLDILKDTPTQYDVVVNFNNIAVAYGEKQVIQKVDWCVHGGSKWLLSGENGAGKSTLLSLINGDHPQAYANDITLFDAKRGSGETIWDIKRKIGYVSPELHWNFDRSMNCLDTVISGFFDTPGLYRRASDEQKQLALDWLNLLELSEYQDKLFANVSSGIQRYLLLARALVKNPPLFIFDEPCQGLDAWQTAKFINLIDSLFADSNHTIIYVSHVADEIPQCISHKLHLATGLVAYTD